MIEGIQFALLNHLDYFLGNGVGWVKSVTLPRLPFRVVLGYGDIVFALFLCFLF